METAKKLHLLREMMQKQGVDAYVQPVHDEYRCEYPPECNQRVWWLSGFSGSAGSLAVTAHKAALFTDGRYTLQAAQQVDGTLYERYNTAGHLPENWLAQTLENGQRIGYDPRLYTRDMLKRLQAACAPKNIALQPVPNLVDPIWQERPPIPASPLFIHALEYAGEDAASKRGRIAQLLMKAGADACVLNTPEDVNWLLNIRGHDVENTPLALLTAILLADGGLTLFVDAARCDAGLRAHLGPQVTLSSPADLPQSLQALGSKRVLYDPQSLPLWFTQQLEEAGAALLEGQEPCLLAKAVKNPVQLHAIRAAHISDGAAVTKLLCWLDSESLARELRETEICDKLHALRSEQPQFCEPSFPTISGSGANGAVVHYRVTPESDRALQPGELFLLDSGGQYPGGTTDITRTVPIGIPSPEQKDRFTRVLKGHIAIAGAIFPEGTGGSSLDALARQYLWQEGLDYDHGTGHGVGQFLGVHEGPQRISKRGGDTPLIPGMIVSNEPGYYKTGEYGIRIENLVIVSEKQRGENGKTYFGFETITCVPIDSRLIETAQLTPQEKNWLNAYHAWVEESLRGALSGEEQRWLSARCAAV